VYNVNIVEYSSEWMYNVTIGTGTCHNHNTVCLRWLSSRQWKESIMHVRPLTMDML